jgi:hypothetical protein
MTTCGTRIFVPEGKMSFTGNKILELKGENFVCARKKMYYIKAKKIMTIVWNRNLSGRERKHTFMRNKFVGRGTNLV